MIFELFDDEEDEFLKSNPFVISIFEVNVENILQQYVNKEKSDLIETDQKLDDQMQQEMIEREDSKHLEPSKEVLKAVFEGEKAYEEHMAKSSQVKEDELEDLNLGTMESPKNVRISVNLTAAFKSNLRDFLFKFKDIFAWNYTDMKGVNSKFYNTKLILRRMLFLWCK